MAITTAIQNLQPTQGKNLYAGNYIDFTDSTFQQWGQQFLPDVYDKEIEIYGNRTISSFLKMVSAEMPSTSDQIIWLEQGRLHNRVVGMKPFGPGTVTLPTTAATNTADGLAATELEPGDRINFVIDALASGPSGSLTNTTEGSGGVTFRVGQTVMVQDEADGTSLVFKGVVVDVTDFGFAMVLYNGNSTETIASTARFTALVYGSEFSKGTGNFTDKLDPSYTTYQNSPIIMKEHYSINGSDTGQIGWVEVTSENGASGYLWYIKAEHENRLRWEDYMEMSMVEGERYGGDDPGQLDTAGALFSFRSDFDSGTTPRRNPKGTEGFFAALRARGNVYSDLSGDLATGTPQVRLSNFDNILLQLDRNGAIEENMLYVDRNLALSFDNLLANQSDFTSNGGGASWGVFNNSSDMALNLGFSGFRRGSYDFYKTDWKYLNDFSTRGGFGDIEGVMIPAGTSTVYDQNLGKNIKRPFLHVRYRASETDNRKMKSWITGSVGGAYTTDVDEMRLHYLTERCVITQGANNFFLLET